METEEEGGMHLWLAPADCILAVLTCSNDLWKASCTIVMGLCKVDALLPRLLTSHINFASVKRRTPVSGPMRKWLKTRVAKGDKPSSSGPLDPMSKWHGGQCSPEMGYRFIISCKGPDQNWRVSSSLDICAIPSYYTMFVPTAYSQLPLYIHHLLGWVHG
jgi:hypothetical protein